MSGRTKPLITYITVVRNGVHQIEATINSILPFISEQVEYVIIDGGSSDGTVHIIRQYQQRLGGWMS